MKFKTTKKAIKSRFPNIYNVGYRNIQSLLRYCEPFAYSSGAYGWSCDYYDLGCGIVLSSGYSCIGQVVDYETLKKWEHAARYLISKGFSYEEEEQAITCLLYDFLEDLEK